MRWPQSNNNIYLPWSILIVLGWWSSIPQLESLQWWYKSLLMAWWPSSNSANEPQVFIAICTDTLYIYNIALYIYICIIYLYIFQYRLYNYIYIYTLYHQLTLPTYSQKTPAVSIQRLPNKIDPTEARRHLDAPRMSWELPPRIKNLGSTSPPER